MDNPELNSHSDDENENQNPNEEYILFEKEEYDHMMKRFVLDYMKINKDLSEDSVVEFIRWAEAIRAGTILLDLFLEDKINVVNFEDNEPVFMNKNYSLVNQVEDYINELFEDNEEK